MKALGRLGWALFGLCLLSTFGCSQLGVVGERGKVDPTVEVEVQHVVWDLVMRVRWTGPPPAIRWVTGAALNCELDGVSGFEVLVWDDEERTKVKRVCRQGYTFGPQQVSVALLDGYALSSLPVAHEMEHVKLTRLLRGAPLGDPLHQEPEFQRLVSCGVCGTGQVPDPFEYCRMYPDPIGRTCTAIYRNPCGACGEVEWANEQLQRLGR